MIYFLEPSLQFPSRQFARISGFPGQRTLQTQWSVHLAGEREITYPVNRPDLPKEEKTS